MTYYTKERAETCRSTLAVMEEHLRTLLRMRHQEQHCGYIRGEIRHTLLFIRKFRGNNYPLLRRAGQ